MTFPDTRDGERSARVWVQAGKRQDDGLVVWHKTNEHVVAGPPLEAALDSPPIGSTVYEAAARAVYGLCQALGYIPADATQETPT
ncbi:MAG TPA: hypothetical protein VFS21_33280 [Roseiflexaceae bacterium]|nr:hypothetical protein [Roseiflexaceae bacterium]